MWACFHGVGVNAWGASPLCGNTAVGLAFMVRTMAQALDRSNCGIARSWKPQSKLMSRRTERPYKADGTDKLAQHSKVPCSVPEVNGSVAQPEFTSLLREICAPSTPATEGAAVREDRRESTEVSRG